MLKSPITVICDPGTTFTKMHIPGVMGPDEILMEPSVVTLTRSAADPDGEGEVDKVGSEAKEEHWEKSGTSTKVVWPIDDGKLEMTRYASSIIAHLALKAYDKAPSDMWSRVGGALGFVSRPQGRTMDERIFSLFHDRTIRFITAVTPDSRHDQRYLSAVCDVATKAFKGAKVEPYLVTQTMAAAIGSGVSIDSQKGYMILGMGGGTMDVSIIANHEEIAHASRKAGGRKMDRAINAQFHRTYGIHIGEYEAERHKIDHGCAIFQNGEAHTFHISGLSEKGQQRIEANSNVIFEAIDPILGQAEELVNGFMRTRLKGQARLRKHIADSGMVVTGGPSQIPRLSERLAKATSIRVDIADSPQDRVMAGMKILAEKPETLKKVAIRT